MRWTPATKCILAGDEQKLQDAVKYILDQPVVFFDIESVGDHRLVPHLNEVTWISLSSSGCDLVIPMGHPIGTKQIGEHKEPRLHGGVTKMFRVPDYEDPPPQLERGTVFEILTPLFMSDELIKVAHQLPFDMGSVTKYLPEMPHPPYDDTKGREWLINENRRGRYGIKDISKRRHGLVWDTENTGKRVEVVPFGKVAHYSFMDSHAGLLTYLQQEAELSREYGKDMRPVKLEWNLIGPLTRMRLRGMPVDIPRLRKLEAELSERMVAEEGEIYRAAGQKFNLNSHRQRQEILYLPKDEGGQGLKPWKMTPGARTRAPKDPVITDYSTDDEVLASYPRNPVASSMRQYGDTKKLLSTYVQSWLGVEGTKKTGKIYDGRIFAAFDPYGAATGRFSSSDPNLQNVPRADTEDGLLLRGAFLAPPGWDLVVADYGQIELVILAHLIGHGKLFEGFMKGIDPHTVCAAGILRREPVLDVPGGITREERQKYGKTMGFTIVNGAGYKKVAAMIGGTTAEAKSILAKHERQFPEIYKYKRNELRAARDRKPPHVTTLLGRKRRIPELRSADEWRRAAAERQAFNSLMQGGAADLIKLAMTRFDKRVEEAGHGAYLALTVHDELVAVSPSKYAEETKELLIDAMTGPGIQKLVKVPLKIDINIGKRWSDCH